MIYLLQARRAAEMGSKIGTTTLSSGNKRAGATLDASEEEKIIATLNNQASLHEKVKHHLFYC